MSNKSTSFSRSWSGDSSRRGLGRTVCLSSKSSRCLAPHPVPSLTLFHRRAAEKLIKKRYDIAVSLTLTLLKFEATAFTQNDHYLSTSKESLLALYKGVRADRKAPNQVSSAFTHSKNLDPSDLPQSPRPPSNGTATTGSTKNVGGLFGTFTSATAAPTPTTPLPFAFPKAFGATSNGASSLFGPATGTQTGATATPDTTSAAPKPTAPASAFSGFGFAPAPQKKPQPAATPLFPQSSQLSVPTTPSTPPPSAFVPIAKPAAPTILLSEEERRRAEAEALSNLAKLGFDGIVLRDLGRLRPDDEYQRELEVMAEVRAYFKVAYKVNSVATSCGLN